MKRILVGTDGSPDGQAALHWATGLALQSGAELVVATAWTPTFTEVPPDEYDELREEVTQRLDEEWSDSVRAAGVAYRALVLDGDPRETLLPAADAEDADLVVVGARGTGGRHHSLHLGSIAHHLVHHAERPLATIPVATRASWPSPIVVGVDGSEHSLRALAWAVSLAGTVGGAVVAAYAEHPPAEWVPHDDPKSWYGSAVAELETWVAPTLATGTDLERVVVDQAPAPGLAELAHRERAGLVVIGARGKGGVTGVRLGGTTLKVLHQSELPVVIVP